MYQIHVPSSSIELHIMDKQNPKFERVNTENLWLTVSTSLDHPPIQIPGELNQNVFKIPSYSFQFANFENKKVYAIILTINVEGQHSADTNTLSVQPKWEFHVSFYDAVVIEKRYMATSWSNDNTAQLLHIKWNLKTSISTNMTHSDIELLQSKHVSHKMLQKTIQESCTSRQDSVLKAVSVLFTKDLNEERSKNYYTVPCAVLGPIGQVRIVDENFLSKSFSDIQHEMPMPFFVVDYEQAAQINEVFTQLRPQYWFTLATHIAIQALVDIWQHESSNSPLTSENVHNIFETFVNANGVDKCHELFVKLCAQFVSAHLTYTPDTNMTIMQDGNIKNVVGDGSGESQLMSGINTRCSTHVRRQKNSSQSLLPANLQANSDVDGDQEIGDCEDGALKAAAIMNFVKNLNDNQFDALWSFDDPEILSFKQTIRHFMNILTKSSRVFGACLGVASAANKDAGNNAQFEQPVFTNLKDSHKCMNDNLSNTTIQGHCWCAGGNLMPCKDAINTDNLMEYDDLIDVQVCELRDIQHEESTNLTFNVSKQPDPAQQLKFSTNNQNFSTQLQHFESNMVRFSTAASIRNNIFAQFLNENNKKTLCTGVQFSNDGDRGGFLQWMFTLRGWNIFSYQKDECYLAATIPQWNAFKTFAIRKPCSADEKKAISMLVQCDVAKYPRFSSCHVLPPHLCRLFGKPGNVAVLYKNSAQKFENYDDLLRQQMQLLTKTKACGFRMVSWTRTIIFFEN